MSERSPEGQDPSQYKAIEPVQDRAPLFTRIRRSKSGKGLAAGAVAGVTAFGASKLFDRGPEGPVKPSGTPQAEQTPRIEGAYYGSLSRALDGTPVMLHGKRWGKDNSVNLDDEGSIELPGHFDAKRKTVVVDIDKTGISPEEASNLAVYSDVAINGEVQPFILSSSVADGRIEADVRLLTRPEPPNPTPMESLPKNDLKKNPPPPFEKGAPPPPRQGN